MVYLLMFIGLGLLLCGANFLVDSSVSIAKRFHISNFVIGLTIVGMGTSSPELYISMMSAVKGMGDIAVGNVLGSNICNTMLILGTTAIIAPFAVERSNLRRDIPMGVAVSILLFLICGDALFFGVDSAGISRFEGMLLLVAFAAFLWYTIKGDKKNQQVEETEPEKGMLDKFPTWGLTCIAIISLAMLLYGGDMFLNSAVDVAKNLGMSDSVISITIVAVGTSLPELITCIIAAYKGNSQLALGNVLGSNIFNILLILGLSATIAPIGISGINYVDFGVLITASILTFIFAFTLRKRVIDRAEGIIFVIGYIIYTIYLLMR